MSKEDAKAIQICNRVCVCVCRLVVGVLSGPQLAGYSASHGSLGKRVFSGELSLLPNKKTTVTGYCQQWALLDAYGSSHYQWIQLHYLIL